jgi:DNA-binding MarR family transcriptional regulator
MPRSARSEDEGPQDFSVLKSERVRELALTYAREVAPPGSVEHVLACTAMRFGHRAFENRLEIVLKPFNLSPQALEVLLLLRVQPKRTLPFPELRTLLGLHPASLSFISDRLAADGRIERLPHDSDRRVVVARLTTNGNRVLSQALKALSDIDYGLPELSRSEALRLAELLGGIAPPAV